MSMRQMLIYQAEYYYGDAAFNVNNME
jgi:hypothetical protein